MKEINKLLNNIKDNPKIYCKKQLQLVALLETRLTKYKYEENKGLAVIAFLETLPQSQLEFNGKPLVLSSWQRLLILAMYGFYDIDNHLLHTETFLEIGKKNGKTLLGSGLLIYELLNNKGAQIYTVATDYEQAGLAFDNVVNFIVLHPLLSTWEKQGLLKVNHNKRIIVYQPNLSKIKCISEDRAKNLQGKLPSFILFDEVASYKNYNVITRLESAKPTNAISLYITTAETNVNNPGYALYQRSETILNKKYISDSFLPVIYELDIDDDWRDSSNYKKANPNLDITTTTTKILVKERDDALIDNTGELERAFRSYKLNMWLTNNLQAIDDEDWNLSINNASKYKDYIKENKLSNYPCYGAIDLSKKDDYTAYSLCFYIEEINKFYLQHKFYIPSGMVEKKAKTEKNISLYKWIDKGFIIPTNGGGPYNKLINYDYLIEDIKEDMKKYSIEGIALDPSFQRDKFTERLEEQIPDLTVFYFKNDTNHICAANRRYIEEITNDNIVDDNPVMAWMISCVRFQYGRKKTDLFFEKIDYKASSNRIDGVDTSVMALGSLVANIDIRPQIKIEQNKKKLLGFFSLKTK